MIDMSKYETPSVQNYIKEVRIRLGNVVENILEMGELYVEACKKFSRAKKEFEKAFPEVREATWEKFKMIGTHRLAASAFFLDSSFARRLVSKKVPVRVQEKLVSAAGVNVYRKESKKVECVPFTEFTPVDEEVVFDAGTGKVRSEKEQRIFVNSMKGRKRGYDWVATDDGIKCNCKCFIKWEDLEPFVGRIKVGK